MRRERVREHVGAVRVRAAVLLRSGLALGVRLDQEAAEVRDQAVDLVGLALPPRRHLGSTRVGGREAPDLDRRAEAGAEIDADAVGPEDVGERRGLRQIRRREAGRVGIDIGQHRAVDADRGVGARVVRVAGIAVLGQLVPVPEREAGVAALDRAVQVVPVVEHAMPDARGHDLVQAVDRTLGLDTPEQIEGAVQDADVGVRGDQHDGCAAHGRRAEQEALAAERGKIRIETEGRDLRAARLRAGDEHALASEARDEARLPPEQASQADPQLLAGGIQRGRVARHQQALERRAVGLEQGRAGHEPVAEPQLIAVLGAGRHGRRERDEREQAGEGRTTRERTHQTGTSGTRSSLGSAQRSFGTSGVQPGRSGSWS